MLDVSSSALTAHLSFPHLAGCCGVSVCCLLDCVFSISAGVEGAEKNHEKPLLISGHLCMLFSSHHNASLPVKGPADSPKEIFQMSLSSSGSLYSSALKGISPVPVLQTRVWGLFLS